MNRPGICLMTAIAMAVVSVWGPQSAALAQVPAASAAAAGAPNGAYAAADLEKLVAPFALYPDDLVAIILPASTFPLQLVQADRFLDKRKSNPKLAIDDGWDDSVKSLVNYPEVVKKMSGDLEWTEALGEAVVSSNGAVMEAVQAFRRRAQTAGNLKSDGKQLVQVESQVITITQADPTIIYVPQYQPEQVVVAGAPAYYGYSAPYPVYYYPYAPGAALAAGIIWGAAIGAVWGGGRYGANYGGGNNNITINRGNNNVNTGNIGSGNRGGGNRASQQPAGGSTWKSSKQPGQVGGSSGNRAGNTRVGDPRPSTGTMGASGGQRAGQVGGGGAGGASASTRPSGDGGAFGGMDSGASANRASARGQESRGGAAGGYSGAGGGARAAPTGGGARSSGGVSGGGGRGGGGGGGGGRGGGGGGGRR